MTLHLRQVKFGFYKGLSQDLLLKTIFDFPLSLCGKEKHKIRPIAYKYTQGFVTPILHISSAFLSPKKFVTSLTHFALKL